MHCDHPQRLVSQDMPPYYLRQPCWDILARVALCMSRGTTPRIVLNKVVNSAQSRVSLNLCDNNQSFVVKDCSYSYDFLHALACSFSNFSNSATALEARALVLDIECSVGTAAFGLILLRLRRLLATATAACVVAACQHKRQWIC